MDERGAAVVAEHIRAAVRGLHIPHGFSPVADVVTISIGIATANRDMPEPEALIRAADKMLYQAKAAGRDRYCQIERGPLP